MKSLQFVVLLGLLSCVACHRKSTERLPPQKMQAVLTDIHLAEAYSAVINKSAISQPDKKNLDSLARFYAMICKHHGISREQFYESLAWYRNHPDQMDSLYSKMLPDMTRLEAAYGTRE